MDPFALRKLLRWTVGMGMGSMGSNILVYTCFIGAHIVLTVLTRPAS